MMQLIFLKILRHDLVIFLFLNIHYYIYLFIIYMHFLHANFLFLIAKVYVIKNVYSINWRTIINTKLIVSILTTKIRLNMKKKLIAQILLNTFCCNIKIYNYNLV